MKRRLEATSAQLPFGELDDLLQHPPDSGPPSSGWHQQLSLSRLKALLDETDGNLGAQMRKLEDAGYVVARKEFQDRRPVTWYTLTAKGNRALSQHLAHLERLIQHARRTRG